MAHLGDFKEDHTTLNHKFTTRSAAGVPTNPVGLAVKVYTGSATGTEIDTGVTLVATGNFDGITGLNNLLIDLSADAFYAIGADYHVVITAGTVDGVSVVGEVICTFSIENRFDEVGSIAAGGIVAASFAADAIAVAAIATGAFTADAFAADALIAATFATGALTADAFAADALIAATFATGAFTADVFAADALIAATFATGAFTADVFAADALIAATFAADYYTAIEAEANDALTAWGSPTQAAIDALHVATDADIAAVKAETALIVGDTGTTIPAQITAAELVLVTDLNDIKGTSFVKDTDSLKNLTHTKAGGGGIVHTITVTIAGVPLADVEVDISSDAAGNVIVATGETGVAGTVVFYLDAGTYYSWAKKASYNFTNPTTETVA